MEGGGEEVGGGGREGGREGKRKGRREGTEGGKEGRREETEMPGLEIIQVTDITDERRIKPNYLQVSFRKPEIHPTAHLQKETCEASYGALLLQVSFCK